MSVQPTDVLHPGATHSPGRYAGADTRTAALLRYAGLRPTDIPPTADGGPAEVTEAEAVAELRRRGLDPAGLPEPLPPLPRDEARALVRTMLGMGAFLMPVHPGRKTPVGAQWQHQPAVGMDRGRHLFKITIDYFNHRFGRHGSHQRRKVAQIAKKHCGIFQLTVQWNTPVENFIADDGSDIFAEGIENYLPFT